MGMLHVETVLNGETAKDRTLVTKYFNPNLLTETSKKLIPNQQASDPADLDP